MIYKPNKSMVSRSTICMWPTLLKHFYIRATVDLFKVKASYFTSFISLSVYTPICEVPVLCVPKAFKRIVHPEINLLISLPHFETMTVILSILWLHTIWYIAHKTLFFVLFGAHGHYSL